MACSAVIGSPRWHTTKSSMRWSFALLISTESPSLRSTAIIEFGNWGAKVADKERRVGG